MMHTHKMGVKTFNDFTFTALHREQAKLLTSSPKAYFNEQQKMDENRNKYRSVRNPHSQYVRATLVHSLNSIH